MKVSLFLIFALAFVALLSFAPEAEAATRRIGRARAAQLQAVRRSGYSKSPSRSRAYAKQSRRLSAASSRYSAAKRAGRKASRVGRKTSRLSRKSSRVGRKSSRAGRKSLKKSYAAKKAYAARRARKVMATRRGRKALRRNSRKSARTSRKTKYLKSRRGKKASGRSRYAKKRYYGRRGRQEEGEEVPAEDEAPIEDEETLEEVEEEMLENALDGEEMPENEIEAEMVLDAMENAITDPVKREEADENADGVPDWCNPIKPMGAWLNFRKMKLWCAERGFTKFGPYGGVPMTDAGVAEESAEASTDDGAAEEDADADYDYDLAAEEEMAAEGDDEDAL